MPDTALTLGAHHIGLTVPDLARTRAFFVDTLGFDQVGEAPDYPAAFVSDGVTMITLWQAEDPATAVPFDRRKVIGLHHLGRYGWRTRTPSTGCTSGCGPLTASR